MSQLRVNSVTNVGGTGSTYAPGHVVQVVSATKTDTFTTASTTFADVTGLSVSITPSSATSKIYVVANVSGSATPATVAIGMRLMRDSTAIAVGNVAGSRTPVSLAGIPTDNGQLIALPVSFLDSPATTSATTYKIQVRGNTANTVAVNRGVTDTDGAAYSRTVSTITVMEVAQ